MLLAAMDHEDWLVVIASVGAVLGALLAQVLTYLRLVHIGHVAEQTHALVNSAMTTALRQIAIYARRVAALTRDPYDEQQADAAEEVVKRRENEEAVRIPQPPLDL